MGMVWGVWGGQGRGRGRRRERRGSIWCLAIGVNIFIIIIFNSERDMGILLAWQTTIK